MLCRMYAFFVVDEAVLDLADKLFSNDGFFIDPDAGSSQQ